MKLLFCPSCGDVVKLRYTVRTCSCGMHAGRYVPNGLDIEVTPAAHVLAIHNVSLLAATQAVTDPARADAPLGPNLRAWMFPDTYGRIARKTKAELGA